jgi:cytochrome c-type biogenesis protein CcmH
MKYLMRFLQPLVFLIALLTSAPSWAVQPDEVLSDPALEARARAISKELRCMVCQNESIDDSDAPLAHDLRVLVRERLKAGDSDQQIINFLVSRYGEFVLLRPPLSWHTAALWGTPPALVLLGIIMIVMVERRRRAMSQQTAPLSLTPAEEARLAEILRGDAGT